MTNATFVAGTSEVRESLNWQPATLYIGPGKLWTEDEVQAELARKDAKIEALIGRLKQQAGLCNFKDDHDHELKMNAAYINLITYKP